MVKLTQKENGTYDSEQNIVTYEDGYQVSFFTTQDNYLTDESKETELAHKIWEGEMASGSKFNYGCYGDPEISFHFKTYDDAMAYAQKYNQESIWDHKKGNIKENPKYDPTINPINFKENNT